MFFDLVKRDPIFIVSMSAAIGAGKSTVVRRLEQTKLLNNYLPSDVIVVFVQEPVAMWKEKGWLQSYYKNQHKNALPFQLAVMDSHVKAVAQALKPYRGNETHRIVCIVERCSWDQLLFWNMQVDAKFDSADDFGNKVYKANWDNLSSLIPDTKLIFFGKTSNFETTQARLRESEPNDEPLYAYNETLYKKHVEWYTTPKTIHDVPCVHVNLDGNFNTSDEALDKIA
jgi:deoxyadenosine/deoxycytidine kinase